MNWEKNVIWILILLNISLLLNAVADIGKSYRIDRLEKRIEQLEEKK